MILNVQGQFVYQILSGLKPFTIRPMRKGPRQWQARDTAHMFTGRYLKGERNLIAAPEIEAVLQIEIDPDLHSVVIYTCDPTYPDDRFDLPTRLRRAAHWVNGQPRRIAFETAEVESLAIADGFKDREAFWKYFRRRKKDPPGPKRYQMLFWHPLRREHMLFFSPLPPNHAKLEVAA